MSEGAAVIVFQKKPAVGKVKTRLAATIGDVKAMEVYQYLLDQTHRQLAQMDIPIFVFFKKEIQPAYLRRPNHRPFIQSKGDLGKKMRDAFETVFDLGYKKAIIIGTDCPELKAEDMETAISALSRHDLVIGPAYDGGYYLLGMKKVHEPLFKNKKWSSSTVLSDTLANANALGLKTHELRTLSDVDTYGDLTDQIKDKLGIGRPDRGFLRY